ncbi:MAG: ABC transporter ATP-binding protein [Bryobacterales bacterium]|nr:ABC transporter ATP-binding protein [Bryobacterales bacterium]
MADTDVELHVEFRGVSKSYDGQTLVVRDLDLDVRKGELFTLLGPSGSGKTTSLMMLAGFEAPTAGDILIDGSSVRETPPRKRGIGVVFQNYALFPHMTVGRNLSFPLEIRGVSEERQAEKVRRALEVVRLEGLENRRPGELSGGQQQRVAIARALVSEPSLVLMDEPLGALDRRLREEMQLEIRRIQHDLGVTVVYVTHDQQEAMAMSSRVAVFHRGRIQQVADPETLYEEPEREFVARFIGDNNILRGQVTAVSGGTCVAETPGGPVKAVPVRPFRAGEPAALAIRPERVVLSSRRGLANEFEARIEEILFIGDHLRMRLDLCGNRNFIVKIPNTVGHGAVLKGDRVRLGWAQMDCRALPDERAAV